MPERNARESNPALVARKACGCVVAAFVDLPEYRDAERDEHLADLIRRGYSVEHVTVEQARQIPWVRSGGGCDHDQERLAALGEAR